EQAENARVAEAGPAAGERALMRAVLEDAVHCLVGEVGPRRQRGQLAAEAREWIEAGDSRWPFSFENVCDALGFPAARLRGPLRSLAHPHHAYLPAARRGAERGPDRGLSRQLRWSAAARARRWTAGRSPRKTWRANGALRFRPAVRFTARRKPPVVSVRSS